MMVAAIIVRRYHSPMPTSFWPNGARAAVSLSFDDARPSQVDIGVPILDQHGVKATFYLSPNRVPERLDLWQRAVAAGHEMGNHTVTHPCSGNFPWSRANALEDYTLERFEREVLDANDAIAQALGVNPATHAYCCGQKFVGRGESLRSTVPVIARHFVAGRGFRDEAVNDPTFVDLAQACGVDGDGLPFQGLRAWMDRAADEGGWLIVAAHDIGDDFPRQAMRADVLAAVCAYCADPANGIWMDTVAAIATHIRDAQHSTGV
jgi:peptidoglycan/xylan/chitin deacetylase (PgdA/CDA1 family)